MRIPKEFELPGNETFIHREGDKLIIEPVKGKARTLAEAMKGWKDIDEPFPDVDEVVPSKAMDGNVVQHYANVRAHLERVGTP